MARGMGGEPGVTDALSTSVTCPTCNGRGELDIEYQRRGVCPVCGLQFALRADGALRAHDDGSGYFCDGSGRTDPLAPMTVKRRSS